MVDIPSNYDKTLEVRAREKILRVLYDGEMRSAYSISKEYEIGITLATVVEHLKKLEGKGFISSEDASKGRLIRRRYRITNSGKKALDEFYKNLSEEIKKRPEILKSFREFLRE